MAQLVIYTDENVSDYWDVAIEIENHIEQYEAYDFVTEEWKPCEELQGSFCFYELGVIKEKMHSMAQELPDNAIFYVSFSTESFTAVRKI